MRCLATAFSSVLRRPSVFTIPILLALAACESTTVVQGTSPTQARPPASAPSQPAVPPVSTETLTPAPGTPAELSAETAGGVTKVGLLLPLSGPSAALGQALLNAAQLAVFDTSDEHFMLLPRDTGGTAEGAERAVRAVLSEGAKLILGPFFAAGVSAVAQRARDAGVNVIAFSTDERVAGQGVFLMGFLMRTQVLRVVSYARAQGLSRFAALVPESPYGQAIGELLREAATQAGAEIAAIASYDPAARNATEVVRQLANYNDRHAALLAQRKELAAKGDDISRQALQRLQNKDTLGDVDFDAIMLPEGGERLLALAPLLPYFDIDPARVRLLGTGLWDDPTLGKEPALIGGWYAAADPKKRADFERRYAQLFGSGNPPRLATLGYDATALAVALARNGGFGLQALTNPNGFAGIDGIFRFRADGLNERGLAVLEVQRDGPRIVSPAPTTFAGE